VTTNLPLATDKPVDLGVQAFCEVCKKCAENCPPRAIATGEKTVVRGVRKWVIDPDRCFKFWVANPEESLGCSNCVRTCPWNKRDTWYHRLAVAMARRTGLARRFLLFLDDLLYGRTPPRREAGAGLDPISL